jgi:hypothetical protein
MAISWFCQWDAKDGLKPVLDEHDHQGLIALIRGCPRLVEGHVMTPVQAHDPHYAADLHTSPALVLQLEFAEIADLEHALKPHGYLQALAREDVLPSLADAAASHHAMLTRRYPVARPADDLANGLLSYMVEYAGPAYTPATLISALPFEVRRTMQRNKTVWDDADAMNAAMASPVRAALRKDFHNFPEFEGDAAHYPFRTISVRGDRYRARD